MRTDELIDALSREAEPPAPAQPKKRTLLGVLGGLVIGLALLVTFASVRPDIGVAVVPVLLKAAFSAAAAAVAVPALLRLMQPGRALGWRLGAIVGFVALSALVVVVALLGAAPEARLKAWVGGTFPYCLIAIPLLAVPTAALLTWMAQGLAPTRLKAAGAAIGAVSGGVGAMVYAMYCLMDSAAFVVTWYGVAIGACAALGALVVSRFLRW